MCIQHQIEISSTTGIVTHHQHHHSSNNKINHYNNDQGINNIASGVLMYDAFIDYIILPCITDDDHNNTYNNSSSSGNSDIHQ